MLFLTGINRRRGGDYFTRRKPLDLKSAIGDLADAFAKYFASTEKRVERLRPTRREPPFDLRRGLSNCWLCNGNSGSAATDDTEKFTAFHRVVSEIRRRTI